MVLPRILLRGGGDLMKTCLPQDWATVEAMLRGIDCGYRILKDICQQNTARLQRLQEENERLRRELEAYASKKSADPPEGNLEVGFSL